MTEIEWPPGSGRKAKYTDAEREFMRGFVRQREAGEITRAECISQINFFHEMKIEFGVDITKGNAPVEEPLVPPF